MDARTTVLIVDDNPDVTLIGRIVLEGAGYRVVTACTAAEGRVALATERPDLVLLDVMMEEVDSGFVFARELADAPTAPPVVLVSQIADATARTVDIHSLGARRVVNKPLDPAALVALVGDVLRQP